LVDSSAQTPKKGVASCDKPRVGACPSIRGSLNRTSWRGDASLRDEREPPELKHLSKGRKRNQSGFP